MEFEGAEEAAAAVGYGVVEESYVTESGVMYVSLIESFLDSDAGRKVRGSVQMIFTSPAIPAQPQEEVRQQDR